MFIDIFDTSLNRIGSLQTWLSLTWEERYNDIGALTLEVVQDEKMVSLLKPWNYCTISDSDQVMVILSVQIKNGHITAYGKSAISILERRYSDTVVSNTRAEAALLSLVRNMQPWDYLTSGEDTGIPDVFTSQTSDGSIYDYFKTISKSVDMGFKVLKKGLKGNLTDENNEAIIADNGEPLQVFTTDKDFTVVCYKPSLNINARYRLDYGNLTEVEFAKSYMDYYNVAIVAGAGEGNDRVKVYSGATETTGINRFEMYVDARDLQQEEGETLNHYKARLVARGEEKLIEKKKINNVKFQIVDDTAALGDLVTVYLPEFGINQQIRITSRTITSENNEIKIELGVGESIL